MAPPIPPLQRAVIQSSTPGVLEFTQTRAVPKLLDNQVLVRVAAVALNPCDWKMPTNFPCPGAGVGADFSGTIVQLGNGIPPAQPGVKVGDRVAGTAHGCNRLEPQGGAFAEYIAVCADQIWRVPPGMSFAEAAGIGFCVVGTVGLATLSERHLALSGSPEKPLCQGPGETAPWVLVYGGSTASGTIAIQMLKQSGYRVITTCSPANFPLVESYGADKAIDYHSATVGESIRAHTGNNLRYVVDIIASAKSLRHCYTAIGRAGGSYVGFEMVPEELAATRKTVKATWVLGIRMFGTEIAVDRGYGSPADPELRAWGCQLFKRTEALIWEGVIKGHPIELDEKKGFIGIMEGVERLRRGEISGKKLVYLINPR